MVYVRACLHNSGISLDPLRHSTGDPIPIFSDKAKDRSETVLDKTFSMKRINQNSEPRQQGTHLKHTNCISISN